MNKPNHTDPTDEIFAVASPDRDAPQNAVEANCFQAYDNMKQAVELLRCKGGTGMSLAFLLHALTDLQRARDELYKLLASEATDGE